MRFSVYQRHIDRGFGGKGCELICPIAIAMTEALGVKIGVWKGRAWNIATGESYQLPDNAIKAYVKYDHGYPMKPFDFEIAEFIPKARIVKEEEPEKVIEWAA